MNPYFWANKCSKVVTYKFSNGLIRIIIKYVYILLLNYSVLLMWDV